VSHSFLRTQNDDDDNKTCALRLAPVRAWRTSGSNARVQTRTSRSCPPRLASSVGRFFVVFFFFFFFFLLLSSFATFVLVPPLANRIRSLVSLSWSSVFCLCVDFLFVFPMQTAIDGTNNMASAVLTTTQCGEVLTVPSTTAAPPCAPYTTCYQACLDHFSLSLSLSRSSTKTHNTCYQARFDRFVRCWLVCRSRD
jgi:uncharacterized membrane protein